MDWDYWSRPDPGVTVGMAWGARFTHPDEWPEAHQEIVSLLLPAGRQDNAAIPLHQAAQRHEASGNNGPGCEVGRRQLLCAERW